MKEDNFVWAEYDLFSQRYTQHEETDIELRLMFMYYDGSEMIRVHLSF